MVILGHIQKGDVVLLQLAINDFNTVKQLLYSKENVFQKNSSLFRMSDSDAPKTLGTDSIIFSAFYFSSLFIYYSIYLHLKNRNLQAQ